MAKKAEFSIETVKKYIFWVCIPLALIISLIVVILSVARIGKAFVDRKTALDSQKKAIETIRSEADHPNEKTIAEIKQYIRNLKGRVQQAWRTLEKDQRERNLWPKAVGPTFNAEVSKLKFGDEITIESREFYLNFIEKYLPSLEEFVQRRRVQVKQDGKWVDVDAADSSDPLIALTAGGGSSASGSSRRSESSGRPPRMGGGSSRGGPSGGSSMRASMGADASAGFTPQTDEYGEEIERMTGIVDWPAPETREITAHWGRLPKSNEVWYAQEELWVYYALLWVIKTSNEGTTGPHNACIKRIESLLIGQEASQELSAELQKRIGGSAGGMMDSMMGPSGMDSSMSSGPGGYGGGEVGGGAMVARTEEDVILMKKQFRYVDELGNPLGAEDEPPFGQFNRMPVILRLIVDQRKIPDILVNCANCAMPIDVLRVRINPDGSKPYELSAYDASAVSDGGGGGEGAMGGPGGYGSDMSGGGRSMSSGPTSGSSSGGGDDISVQLDGVGGIYGSNAMPIEIYGCINIFNPVESDDSLRIQDTDDLSEQEESEDAAETAEEE